MVKNNNILFMLMLFIISTLISTYAKEEELYENLAEVHADGNIVIIDDEGTTCDVTEEYCGMKYNLDYLKKLHDVARKYPVPKCIKTHFP